MKNKVIEINDKISYIEMSENPLSADIGIIKEKDMIWLFDVGMGENSFNEIPREKVNVVLSHFHQDHTGNLGKLDIRELYVSKETFKHTKSGTFVDKEIYVDGLHIFSLPSSHSAGSLGLEVNNKYAFVGDALYSKSKNGQRFYNAQLLKAEIEVLKNLKAQYLLVSHYKGLVREKEEVIEELEVIYSKREKNDPYIYI